MWRIVDRGLWRRAKWDCVMSNGIFPRPEEEAISQISMSLPARPKRRKRHDYGASLITRNAPDTRVDRRENYKRGGQTLERWYCGPRRMSLVGVERKWKERRERREGEGESQR